MSNDSININGQSPRSAVTAATGAQTALETYKYRPLADNEIRLLELQPLPQSGEAPLAFALRHVTLDQACNTEYEAISYVWGSAVPSTIVTVDGRKLLLPANSEEVLRRVAHLQRPRTLWIDAACINQADLQERAQQVAFMSIVYSRAMAVLVWLGDSDELSERAIANIEAMNQEINEDVGPDIDITNDEVANEHKTHMASTRTPIDHEALVPFYSRAWFNRVWVVQEFILAKSSQGLCGSRAIDMAKVLKVAYWLRTWHHFQEKPRMGDCLHTSMLVWRATAEYRKFSCISPHNLLYLQRARQASDPRDKVFGVLGLLLRPLLHSSIMPDYHKPVAHVFRDVVRRNIMAMVNSMAILSELSHFDSRELETGEFPSWVPRFDRPLVPKMEPYRMGHVGEGSKPLGSHDLAGKLAEDFEDPNILTVRGILLTSIVEVWPLESRLHMLDLIHGLLNRGFSRDVVARTLIADSTIHGVRSSVVDMLAFQDYLSHLENGIPLPDDDKLTPETPAATRRATLYFDALLEGFGNRVLAATDCGSLILVPRLCDTGDIVVFIHGGCEPYLLRQSGAHYLLLGECYLDGYMAWQEHRDEIDNRLLRDENRDFNLR